MVGRKKGKRIIFAGGGTGGHVFMAVAITQYLDILEVGKLKRVGGLKGASTLLQLPGSLLRDQDPGVGIRFVGTPGGLENRILPSLGIDLDILEVGKLKRVLEGSFDATPAARIPAEGPPDLEVFLAFSGGWTGWILLWPGCTCGGLDGDSLSSDRAQLTAGIDQSAALPLGGSGSGRIRGECPMVRLEGAPDWNSRPKGVLPGA